MQTILAIHAALAGIAVAWMTAGAIRRGRRERRAASLLRLHARREGPPTLHPVIDPDVCIGSGACVRACPEHRALVIVKGRGHLAHASGCVGHGECQRACPVQAISLVFGTERRGVDLPELDPRFETSQQGLHIAGELGGMGLVATAVRQGVKAVEAIDASLRDEGAVEVDAVPLLVVGAGPAGIAAALAAREHGVACRLIEQAESIGGSVRAYPRGKIVMTTPVELPMYGRFHMRRTTKAALIELWTDVLARGEIVPEFGVTLRSITRDGDCLVADTSAGPIRARRILLATGRRGRPRRLGIAGEDLPHVHHNIDDPTDQDRKRCVVIGGGDTAVEAALALAERPGTTVVLCHRGTDFVRAKPENQDRLAEAEAAGLRVIRGGELERIDPTSVAIRTASGVDDVPADAVFVLIGADLPVELLAASGVRVQTHRGERRRLSLSA